MLEADWAFSDLNVTPTLTDPKRHSVSAMSIRSSSIFLLKPPARADWRVEWSVS